MTPLINVPRYHVFKWDNTLFLLNENRKGGLTDKDIVCYFEFHRICKDGRTKLSGMHLTNYEAITNCMVEDLGHLHDWMQANHPIRYKRELWEDKPRMYYALEWDNYMGYGSIVIIETTDKWYNECINYIEEEDERIFFYAEDYESFLSLCQDEFREDFRVLTIHKLYKEL